MAYFCNEPLPTSRLEMFEFPHEECLYRDVFGRRVVADWEGDGMAYVLSSDAQLHINGVLLPHRMFHSFHDFGTIVAEGPGTCLIAVTTSKLRPESQNREYNGEIKGAGYVYAASSTVRVDGEADPRCVFEGLPIPFFQSVDCGSPYRATLNPSGSYTSIALIDVAQRNEWSKMGIEVQNMSANSLLDSTWSNGSSCRSEVASHLNAMEFSIEVPPHCAGLRLRKTYDRFHGRQRAWVIVDGIRYGPWFAPIESRNHRWGRSEFGIELEPNQKKRTVRLSIDPLAGSPLWSVAQLEILAAPQP